MKKDTSTKRTRLFKLARKVARRNRFSKRVASGLIFIGASLVGGFLSSLGTDIYHTIKSVISNQLGFSLSFPQIVFLIIGLVGIALMVSGFEEIDNKPRVKRKSRNIP